MALERGYDVDIVAMRRDPGEPGRAVVDGAQVYRLPLMHRRGAGPLRVLLEYLGFTALSGATCALLSARRRYGAVHVNNPPDFLVVAALPAKLRGAGIILDVHDLSADMFDMRFGHVRGARLVERFLDEVQRFAGRLADVVITVHEPYRRELIARGIAAEKTEVVMNSLDEALLERARSHGSAAPHCGSANGRFRVVYHGTITPHYGVHVLVEAMPQVLAELPDVALQVYGEGDSVPAIAERVRELGLDDHVHVSARYLPHHEILGVISGASVGVIPNVASRLHRFALSSKLFEYVAVGVPVVASDLPTLRAHFPDGELRFFRSGDPSALAQAILDTARDPEAAAARARAARERYEQYRWPVYARRYAQVLDSLAARAEDRCGRRPVSAARAAGTPGGAARPGRPAPPARAVRPSSSTRR